MIFIPCEKGISHNEAENVQEQDLVIGAQTLCDTILSLASLDTLGTEIQAPVKG